MIKEHSVIDIDENRPDLSGIPDFLLVKKINKSGYGHHHVSGSLNFIKNIFRIIFVRPFSSMDRENLLLPLHGLLFMISSKDSFICTIPWPLLHQLWRIGWNEK